jgi:heme A synthase
MKVGPVLIRITAVVVVLQLLLGGLVTFNFMDPVPHLINGFIVLILAIATMAASVVSKPSYRPLKATLIAMVILILLQIIIGFVLIDFLPALGSSSDARISWIHFVNAMAIYGLTISGVFLAVRWDQLARKA